MFSDAGDNHLVLIPIGDQTLIQTRDPFNHAQQPAAHRALMPGCHTDVRCWCVQGAAATLTEGKDEGWENARGRS